MGERDVVFCEVFGGFRVLDRTGTDIPFPVAKGAAILAYLVLSKTDRVDRGTLTGLLWSERPEVTARTALRQCLYQLKGVLPRLGEGVLTVTADAVFLDPRKLRCDVNVVLDPENALSMDSLARADPQTVLRGFEDLDPGFSEWLNGLRSDVENRLRALLTKRIKTAHAHPEQRQSAAEHLFRLDPAQEIAARVLIEHAAKQGDLVSLLRVYKTLWETLDTEWGDEPTAELQAFVGETRVRLGNAIAGSVSSGANDPAGKSLTALAMRPCGAVFPEGFVARAVKEIEGLGGLVLRNAAAALDCVFGLPFPGEFDARDGLDAALRLRDLAENAFSASLSFGLDSGIMFARPGRDDGASPHVTGKALDRAAGLAEAADRPVLRVTEHTIRRLRHLYTLSGPAEDARAQVAEAIGDPDLTFVDVLAAQPPEASAELPGRGSTFIGRAPFLAALRASWAEAVSDRTLRSVSIQGAAGVGKTRLADEFLESLARDGIRTARVVCDRTFRHEPYDAPLRLIGTFENRTADRSSAGTAGLLPDHVAARLAEAISTSPAAFLVDDWQWADDATRAALGRFIVRGTQSPCLIILTSRETPIDDWLVATSQQILLPNMTAREVEEKAARLLRQPLERHLRQEIFAKSGGNPLFLEEICHSLAHAGNRPRREALVSALPANMQSLIASRIERLSAEDMEIVLAASVHGVQVDIALLTTILGRPIAQETIRRLVSLDIMNPVTSMTDEGQSTDLRFKHGVARDVACSLVAPDRLRALHLAYADALRSGTHPENDVKIAELLAMHYSGGQDLENALHFSEISGDKALESSALDQAMWHYETALNVMDQMPADADLRKRWISIARRWAIPCVYSASRDHLPTLERAESVARQIGDFRAVAWARYWIGYLHFVLGDSAAALSCLKTAMEVAERTEDARLVAEAMAIEGCALGSISRHKQAETRMRAAIEAKDRNPRRGQTVPVTSMYTRANLALLLADQGRFAEADTLISEAVSRVSGSNHEVESSILNFAAATHLMRRDWTAALDLAMRSRERSEKVSSPYLMGMSRCIWGFAHWKLHGTPDGLEMLSSAARWMDGAGMRLYLSLAFGWLAEAMLDNQRHEDAIAASKGALERSNAGEIIGASMACRAAAAVAIARGDTQEAARKLVLSGDFARMRASPVDIGANHLMLARLHHACGDPAQASAELDAACEVFAAPELARWQALADRTRAALT